MNEEQYNDLYNEDTTILHSDASADAAPKKRGRPRLSDEEKAARATARAEAGLSGRTRVSGRGHPDLPMIQETLETYLTASGLALSGIGLARQNLAIQADSVVIVQNAEPYAHAWCELAKTDKRVYKALKTLCVGGAWGTVIIATAAIIVPIAGNHGYLSPQIGAIFGADMSGVPNGESEPENYGGTDGE